MCVPCFSCTVIVLISYGVFLFQSAGVSLFGFKVLSCSKFRRRTTLGISLHYVPYTLAINAALIPPLFCSFLLSSALLRFREAATER